MSSVVDLVQAAFEANPIYWAGIAVWSTGFVLYVASIFKRGANQVGEFGARICWLGFALTALAHTQVSTFQSVQLPVVDLRFWETTDGLIWVLWIGGSLAIVASWTGLVSHRVGWLGLCVGMTGVLASWFAREQTQQVVIAAGLAVVTFLVGWFHRRHELRPFANPGDYVAELVRLCGSKRKARRLAREERKRSPHLTRQGAALAVVTRLRHERDPYPPAL